MIDGYGLPPDAPGQYRPLREDRELSKAYFPDNLPPAIDLTDDLVRKHADAVWALGRLEGVGSEIDNPGAVFSSFVYKEAEQSSQVEGTAVTVSDLYRYDVDQLTIATDVDTDHEADVREARNYIIALDEAISYLKTAGVDRANITTELIKSLHERLLKTGRSEDDDPLPGEFRPGLAAIKEQHPHGFGERVRFIPPKPDAVPRLVDDLVNYLQRDSRWPPLIDVAIGHYQFETIHPFKDGNGRVGRLLVVLMLVATRRLQYPLLYLSSYIERHRNEYADRLLAVSEEGDWEAWIDFFLTGIERQAEEAYVRAKLLIDKREEYERRYESSPRSVSQLAMSLFEEPYFTVTEATDRSEYVYATMNNAVDTLVDDGVVTEITGNAQNRVFKAKEIMDIVERQATRLPSAESMTDLETAWKLPER